MTTTINPGMSNGDSAHWNYLMRLIPVREQRWMEQAACVGHDPELWFPSDGKGRPPGNGERPETERIKKAKAICAGCPVRNECLTFALENKEDHGIWAGVGRERRRELRRGNPLPDQPARPSDGSCLRGHSAEYRVSTSSGSTKCKKCRAEDSAKALLRRAS